MGWGIFVFLPIIIASIHINEYRFDKKMDRIYGPTPQWLKDKYGWDD